MKKPSFIIISAFMLLSSGSNVSGANAQNLNTNNDVVVSTDQTIQPVTQPAEQDAATQAATGSDKPVIADESPQQGEEDPFSASNSGSTQVTEPAEAATRPVTPEQIRADEKEQLRETLSSENATVRAKAAARASRLEDVNTPPVSGPSAGSPSK